MSEPEGRQPRRFLVLARTHHEAETWRRRHVLRRSQVVYLAGPWTIYGRQISEYAGVLLPSFHDRPDAGHLEDILRQNADAGTDWPLWREAAIERAML